MLFKDNRQGKLKPSQKKQGMAGWWRDYNRNNVIGKNKTLMVWPVENKQKLVLRMLDHHLFKGFKGKASDTIYLLMKQ